MGYYRVKDELRYLKFIRLLFFLDRLVRKVLGPIVPEPIFRKRYRTPWEPE